MGITPEQLAALTLVLAPGVGAKTGAALVRGLGSAKAVCEASADELAGCDGISAARASKLAGAIDATRRGDGLAREADAVAQTDIALVPLTDAAYPAALRVLDDAPVLLYARGSLAAADAPGLAVVGSRKCSRYGSEQADRFSALAAQAGLSIISGGARGIDAAAHRAALRVKGITAAVLGSGLKDLYPPEHAALYDDIAESGGVVLTEFAMTMPGRSGNFPKRNRLIAALARAVFVVEAAKRSGALITARYARECGTPVLALPGAVDTPGSAGPHELIRGGAATLVTKLDDVLDVIDSDSDARPRPVGDVDDLQPRASDTAPPVARSTATLTDTQRAIVDALADPHTFDELIDRTGLAAPTLQADLTMLELRSAITKAGTTYRLRK